MNVRIQKTTNNISSFQLKLQVRNIFELKDSKTQKIIKETLTTANSTNRKMRARKNQPALPFDEEGEIGFVGKKKDKVSWNLFTIILND